MSAERMDEIREQMVRKQIEERGISDKKILNAMLAVPRHIFVPEPLQMHAYEDKALPLGPEQTISQPYIVAYMLEQLKLKQSDRVLEIGTGSGYQAALLSLLVSEVYTIDIDELLVKRASHILSENKYTGINLQQGDGNLGWSEKAPYDAIIVTAACDHIPRSLINQLADNGRLIIPLGDDEQILVKIAKTPEGIKSEELIPVRFVPLQSDDTPGPIKIKES